MSWAADLIWKGHYRIEALLMDKPELAGSNQKTYFLNHMMLAPKFVPADGITLNAKLHLMSSSLYPNSQLGSMFGQGPGEVPSSNVDNSNVFAEAERMGGVRVSQLYLTWKTEYGALVAGRVPVQFGLGITYSGGQGLFDHWLNNKDILGYKFVVGNTFFMPMYGKVSEGPGIAAEDDVNDLMFHIEYDNPETNLALGAFIEKRTATSTANDAPTNPFSATRSGEWTSQRINFLFRNEKENYRMAVEGGFFSGSTGLMVSGTEVTVDSSGLVTEFEWKAQPIHRYGVKTGFASGDNLATPTKYEGFIFDRNYEVATLLFNHPMGQLDILQTTLLRGATTEIGGSSPSSNNVDNDAVSNAVFFAPYYTYQWKDNLDFTSRFVYAIANSTIDNNDLGFELDFILNYQPIPNLNWQTDVAIFVPGGAYRGGANNYATNAIYGMMTKVAISF
jgi:hypothetical protein